ncbi:MAG: hypothetical protein HY673_04735 [Chloroflexi bacterium]|nr:hypothetical protein [Chloroflexota bacterium]
MELLSQSKIGTGLVREAKAAVVRNGVQRVFAARLRIARNAAKMIVIASPWITAQTEKSSPLNQIIHLINERNIPTYVFTRQPQTASEHLGQQLLMECPTVELVYNPHLHAKLYVCIAPYPYGFAVLGSANMTVNSDALYEIGLLILAAGGGEIIIKELASFGLDYMRTRAESQVVKKMSRAR